MMLTESEKNAVHVEMERCVGRLCEMGCDSVVLLVTIPNGHTTHYNWQTDGNTFACRDNARCWLAEASRIEDDE